MSEEYVREIFRQMEKCHQEILESTHQVRSYSQKASNLKEKARILKLMVRDPRSILLEFLLLAGSLSLTFLTPVLIPVFVAIAMGFSFVEFYEFTKRKELKKSYRQLCHEMHLKTRKEKIKTRNQLQSQYDICCQNISCLQRNVTSKKETLSELSIRLLHAKKLVKEEKQEEKKNPMWNSNLLEQYLSEPIDYSHVHLETTCIENPKQIVKKYRKS